MRGAIRSANYFISASNEYVPAGTSYVVSPPSPCTTCTRGFPASAFPSKVSFPSAIVAGNLPDEFAGIVSFQEALPPATLQSDRIDPNFDSYEKFIAPSSLEKL